MDGLQRLLRQRADHGQCFVAKSSAGQHKVNPFMQGELLHDHDGVCHHCQPVECLQLFGQIIGRRSGIQDEGVPFLNDERGSFCDGFLLQAVTVFFLYKRRLRLSLTRTTAPPCVRLNCLASLRILRSLRTVDSET